MTTPEPAKIGNTTADIVMSLVKGTVGMVPVIGSLIAEIVGNIIPNQRVDRIIHFVQLLDARLGKLERGFVEERLIQPAVVDLLEDAFTQVTRATSTERLEHIANVIANGISQEAINQSQTKRMLWLLGQLNDAEIVILRSRLAMTGEDFQLDSEFRGKHEQLLAPDTTHMGSSQKDFEEAALKRSYRSHLQDIGLVRSRFSKPRRGELPEFDDATGMLKANGTEITRLGRMLLGYLDLIPQWCNR